MEQTQSFNNILRVRYDAIKAMQRQAQKFLSREFEVFGSHLEFNITKGENTYYLSARGGGRESPYGILVGKGDRDSIPHPIFKELQMTYSLIPLVSVLKNSIQSVTGFHYTSASNFYFRYPWNNSEEVKFPSQIYEKEYYIRSLPANNREDKVFWTDVFLSPIEKKLLVTVAAPVYENRQYKGVVGLDFTLSSVDFFVENLHHNLGDFLVVNDSNTVIADLAIRDNQHHEIIHLDNTIPKDLLSNSFSKVSEATLTRIGDYWIYVAHTSFAPWKVIYYVDNKSVALQTIKNILPSLLMVILFTTIFLLLATRLVAREFINPAGLLVRHIERRGQLDPKIISEVSAPWKPWFTAISNVFLDNKTLVEKLEKHIDKLDDQVAKRTKDLSRQNQKLELALHDLQNAQSQIITQEKLAGLGSLTAGIAHEIRNPLNFIVNFADNSRVFGEEISETIQGIESQISPGNYESLKYLTHHLIKNMTKIEEHGRRADTIVNSMLTHAHGGNDILREANLQELLDENILLGLASFKQKGFSPEVTRYYTKSMTNISVYPKDLGRVFLNLINNACFILHEKKKKKSSFKPKIQVKIEDSDNHLTIRVRDNGMGMSDSVKNKIFEPFFTTKPTGQGTGLGLSLSYEIIVQQHRGRIFIETEYKEFTEFTIVLPKDLANLLNDDDNATIRV